MKPDDLFETNSSTQNESTDRRQTSPLGAEGSDSKDKAESKLPVDQENVSIDKPEPSVPTPVDKVSTDKPEVDVEPPLSTKDETVPSLDVRATSPAKTDTVEVIEVAAPEKADPGKTELKPPTPSKTDTVEMVEVKPSDIAEPSTTATTEPSAAVKPKGADTAKIAPPPGFVSPENQDKTEVSVPAAPTPGATTQNLDGSKHDTYVLTKNRTLRAMLEKRPTKGADSTTPAKIVTLMVRGIAERVVLSKNSVIMGRAELQSRGFQPDVDLSPYGAQMRGVSRVHARLFLQDKHLYIADLYSTNGTYIAGRKLEPNDPYRLYNGVEVLLGSLMLQVMFE